ncbi:MAG: M50 family metallopeptidase, partial [Marinosulfonomonas sp.]|nr:M50 family metallopeptidase [Marinosulfonomonas sp.]
MRVLHGHWQLIAITALVFVLWNTPVILPLKILIVFLHEIAHGLAALLTGGSIESISLSPQQGGLTVTRGGNLFVVMSAGYVGSLLIGVVVFLIALKSTADRALMAVLGIATLLVTALYLREWFALAFGVGTGALMLAMARYLSHRINDLVLRIIGLTSMIYVPYDIFSDTIARSHIRSDAYMLAERFGGATMMWGGLWLLISLAVIGVCLRYGLGKQSNIGFG